MEYKPGHSVPILTPRCLNYQQIPQLEGDPHAGPNGRSPVLKHIQRLMAEEQQLHEQGGLAAADRERLAKINAELDQCWDLLRQRRALRDAGKDPDQAEVRPADVVERYIQ